MDIEKLIEQLNEYAQSYTVHDDPDLIDTLKNSAIAFSMYQIENKALRNSVNGFKAENEKLRAENNMLRRMRPVELNGEAARSLSLALEASQLREELEKVKRERDAAIKDIWVPKWISCKNGENCSFVSAVTGMPDCAGCDNWEWRGQKEE